VNIYFAWLAKPAFANIINQAAWKGQARRDGILAALYFWHNFPSSFLGLCKEPHSSNPPNSQKTMDAIGRGGVVLNRRHFKVKIIFDNDQDFT
jgi:hypothetical protein